jgi:hypothetical protein
MIARHLYAFVLVLVPFSLRRTRRVVATPRAPDGHHVTLGEWVNISGSASAKCINQGTHIVIHLSGLLPKAVYTAWLIVPNPAAPPPFLGRCCRHPRRPRECVLHLCIRKGRTVDDHARWPLVIYSWDLPGVRP